MALLLLLLLHCATAVVAAVSIFIRIASYVTAASQILVTIHQIGGFAIESFAVGKFTEII